MSTPTPLSTINSTTLGAQFPTITLQNGQKIPTGTIGALLVNIKHYDAVSANKDDDPEAEEKLKDLEGKFRAALPVLLQVGFFELFEPREWIVGGRSVGRRRVGELAVEAVEAAGEGEGGRKRV